MCTSVTSDVFEELPKELLNSIRHHITSSDISLGDGTLKNIDSFVNVDPFVPEV